MTIGEFLPLYEANHVVNLRSWRSTSRRVQRYIAPLGSIPLGDMKRLDVVRWFQALRRSHGPNVANAAIQDLHSIYERATDWELFSGKNPCDRIKRFPKHTRTRFILSHELPWVLRALSEELPMVETYYLHLLLTGCRMGEAKDAKWADVDLNQGLWHKPTTKTGVPHTVPLPTVLVARLRALPKLTEWVYMSRPNPKNNYQPGQWCRTSIEKTWRRIRKRACLPDLRLHDLRRTCASWLTIHGENLPLVQKVMNHSSLAVTQIYARLDTAPLRRALEEQSIRMLQPVPPPAPSQERKNEEWPG